MEEARIKMVGDASWARENVVSSIVRLVREDGLLSSFSGLPAMLSKQIPYTMGKQVSFDLIAQVLYAMAVQMAVSKEDAKWLISTAAAFLASIVACISSQPGDMILTATYKGGHGSGHGGGKEAVMVNSKDFATIVAAIYRQHGLGGFYLGLQARLAHVASIITSQLVVYDLIKMALGLPVTGSH
jgi:solute carrier family 25 phosphate transporter 3